MLCCCLYKDRLEATSQGIDRSRFRHGGVNGALHFVRKGIPVGPRQIPFVLALIYRLQSYRMIEGDQDWEVVRATDGMGSAPDVSRTPEAATY